VLGLGSTGKPHTGMGDSPVTVVVSFLLSAVIRIGFIATLRRQVTVVEWLVPMSLAMIAVWPCGRSVRPAARAVSVSVSGCGVRALSPAADPWRAARVLMLCVLDSTRSTTLNMSSCVERGSVTIEWIAEAAKSKARWIG